jgi:hypothetical protein
MVKDNWSSPSSTNNNSEHDSDCNVRGSETLPDNNTHVKVLGTAMSTSSTSPMISASHTDQDVWGDFGSKQNFINLHLC